MNPKLIIIIAFPLLSFGACSQKSIKENEADIIQTTYLLLSPIEFNKKILTEPGVIIDVRTGSEQKKGMLKNAISLDIFQDAFEAEIDKLDRAKIYYVYCGSGGRSAEACELMKKKGFTHVIDLDGGYSHWKNEGLPVEVR
ncbi:MAG: rhodanese-like domain-containing protein [Bacteroidia bacterium]|nr:rhodanese-like domain-containing protein [Bacteroidia bacterium]